ncbi:hypothetical protein Tco_0401585 [Tanacetum coccineum]
MYIDGEGGSVVRMLRRRVEEVRTDIHWRDNICVECRYGRDVIEYGGVDDDGLYDRVVYGVLKSKVDKDVGGLVWALDGENFKTTICVGGDLNVKYGMELERRLYGLIEGSRSLSGSFCGEVVVDQVGDVAICEDGCRDIGVWRQSIGARATRCTPGSKSNLKLHLSIGGIPGKSSGIYFWKVQNYGNDPKVALLRAVSLTSLPGHVAKKIGNYLFHVSFSRGNNNLLGTTQMEPLVLIGVPPFSEGAMHRLSRAPAPKFGCSLIQFFSL